MATVIVFGDLDDGLVTDTDASWANLDVAGSSLPSPGVSTNSASGTLARWINTGTRIAEQHFFSFDTTVLLDPSAASFFFYIINLTSQNGNQTVKLLDHNWTAPLATTDYIASSAHGDHTTLGTYTTDGTVGAYQSISLSDISSIDIDGDTTYHLVDSNQSTAPTDGSDETAITLRFSDQAGTSQDPYLSVTDNFVTLNPDADDTDGGWTTDLGGSSLFAAIDEVTVDDSDFIQSEEVPSADKCKIRLSNPGVTVDTAKKHAIRYRYRRIPDSGPAIDLTVRLVQGASTVIATWTHTSIADTILQANQELTGGQISSITDYDDLFFEFEADQP